MKYTYTTKGVCSRKIDLEIIDGKVQNIQFEGGCNGNLKGIVALCTGKNTDEITSLLKGIKCNSKSSSCPEQLAFAIEEALAQ